MAGNSIISQPDVTIALLPATQNVSNTAQRVLFVGQKVAAGTATSGALEEQIGNDKQEDTLYGANSMIAGMIREFKKINKLTRVDAIGLDDDVSGVAATGTVAFSGTAAAAGSFTVTIGSDTNHKYVLPVIATDDATDIGDDLVTAITADTNAPFSAANITGTVTITADNDGTEGNFITLRIEGSAASITPTVTGMASGATNPTLTSVFDVIGDERYQTIVWPYAAELTAVQTLLDARWNPDGAIEDGVALTVLVDTLANLQTAGETPNSESITIIGFNSINDTLSKGSSMVEITSVIASEVAAIRSLRLTQDANLGNFVIATNGALDSFGGPALASFPYFNTPLANLPLIPTNKGFSRVEIEALQGSGISTIGNNTAGNETILGEVVTTYRTDSAGNEDNSFKYQNYVDTGSNIREYFFNNLKSRFAQSRLTEGDVIDRRSMANEAVIRAFMMGLYNDLSGSDYVLVQAGETARKFFNDNLVIDIDLSLGKVTITMKTPVVTQLRQFIIAMQMAFSTEG